MRTSETIFFKLAIVSRAAVLMLDLRGDVACLPCLGLASFGSTHGEKHEHRREQSDESEPAGQRANELDNTCSTNVSPLEHHNVRSRKTTRRSKFYVVSTMLSDRLRSPYFHDRRRGCGFPVERIAPIHCLDHMLTLFREGRFELRLSARQTDQLVQVPAVNVELNFPT